MSGFNAGALLQKALLHHQAGRLDDAQRLYERVIAADRANANALNLLGTIAFARQQIGKAQEFYQRAIDANPGAASAHFNLANLLNAKDEAAAALQAYDRVIALDPTFADARLNKGVLLQKLARTEEAIREFREIAASDVRAAFNLGQCFKALGRFRDAELWYARALAFDPQHSEALLALAEICARAGRLGEAIGHARAAVAARPTPETYSNLGELLRRNGDVQASLEAHKSALKQGSDEPAFLFNYGAALLAAESVDEAAAVFARVLARDDTFVGAYHGLAKTYEQKGRMDAAIEELERGLARAPNNPDLTFQLALRQLRRGQLREGWKNYEARFHTSDGRQRLRATPPPYWCGQDLAGKSILIWTEQGPGDELLYAGMIPEMAARAGRCTVECEPRLVTTFARSFPGVEVRARGTPTTDDNGFDFQCAVASLGQHLRAELSSFPRHVGYLKADPVRTAELRARYLAQAPGQPLVGISWRSRNEDIGAAKNTRLEQWGEVLRTPGTTFVNLQYGDCASELAAAGSSTGARVVLDAEIDPLRDMDAYFAQVAAMDLVITTSNTAVHAAGSLGVSTLLLLPGRPGALWYWFDGFADVPWYPSVRIISPASPSPSLESAWEEVLKSAGCNLRHVTACASVGDTKGRNS